MKTLAKNLYYLRKLNKVTQAEMPDKLGIGRATWSNYENDQTEPDVSTLISISEFFSVSLDELLNVDMEQKGNLTDNERGSVKGNQSGNGKGNLNERKLQKLSDNIGSGFRLSDPQIQYQLTSKQDLTTTLRDTIDSLKQANSTLLQLVEAHKETIARQQQEISELKSKTGP